MLLRPVEQSDAALIKGWLRDDALGRRHVSWYAEPRTWIRLLGPRRCGWIALDNDQEPVGFLDLECEQETGHFTFYVQPDRRGKRYSGKLLALLAAEAMRRGISELVGWVERDNIGSQKALTAAGFTVTSRGTDELDRWSMALKK